MNQIYHPYHIWEGYRNGMYEPCREGRQQRVEMARELLSDAERLHIEMVRVTDEWVNESESVLTDNSINHRAWLGWSACNIAVGAREDETREAWGLLSDDQRKAANAAADCADKRFQSLKDGAMYIQLSIEGLVA